MPQSNHKTLVRGLLWWTTLLSIGQATLLVLFFTMGHFGQNRDTQGGPKAMSSGPEPSRDKAKIFTYQATGVHQNNTIVWYSVTSEDLPTDDGHLGLLSIKKDGSFFMCFRITLYNGKRSEQEVRLVKDNETILTGEINNETQSTGLLCKAEKLIVGNVLRVEIKTDATETLKIKLKPSLSYLDIIYMPN